MHPLYGMVREALKTDASQMVEEGHDEEALLGELREAESAGGVAALVALQEEWWKRPSPPGFAYEEPDDWETISAAFPDPGSHARFDGGEAELADRILAAWQGRCVGCQLGKPLEGTMWPDKIRQVLEIVGSWPLTDYMNPTPGGIDRDSLPDCNFFERAWKDSQTKGRFDVVQPDDDILYAMISQRVLEDHGPDFTSEQAAEKLAQFAPFSCLCASGRNLFRTFVFGLRPPQTAVFGNPCRQSLGAQIRCDPWGWGAPANPALAARMAYTDAVNSQVRNGIYSGIFFAVLMADALAHGDVVRAIGTAEAYVPPRSRFAEMIRFVRDECARTADWQDVNDAILKRWPTESEKFNHSIPNAAIVLLGLLKGDGDFTRTIGITVMAGLDTDCTGATAGSVMGCALGTAGIPDYWTAPLNDTVRSDVKGMPEVRISEMAARMFGVAKENARFRQGEGRRAANGAH